MTDVVVAETLDVLEAARMHHARIVILGVERHRTARHVEHLVHLRQHDGAVRDPALCHHEQTMVAPGIQAGDRAHGITTEPVGQ